MVAWIGVGDAMVLSRDLMEGLSWPYLASDAKGKGIKIR
jgi:hypothetical protein